MRTLSVPLLALFGLLALPLLTPLAAQTLFVAAPSGLVLRDAASRQAKGIILMPGGSAVEVLSRAAKMETIDGKQSVWFEVKFGPHRGWAFGGFLQKEAPENTTVVWNQERSMFFVLRNQKGTPEECANGFAERICSLDVYKDGKIIYQLRKDRGASWRSNREIALTDSTGDCGGGTSETDVIDPSARRTVGTYTMTFMNAGCGNDADTNAPVYYGMCAKGRCATIRKTQESIAVFTGEPDFDSGGDPVRGRAPIATLPAESDLMLEPDIDALRFSMGGTRYEITKAGAVEKR